MYKNSLSEDLPIKSVLFVLEGGGSNMKLDFNASFLCSPLKGNIIDSRHQEVEIQLSSEWKRELFLALDFFLMYISSKVPF